MPNKQGLFISLEGIDGAGKSTLAKVLAGDPSYEVTKGTITFLGKDLLDLDIENINLF